MPKFSIKSQSIIDTCHGDIRHLFKEVIKFFDCKPIYGHRNPKNQFDLFKKGRIQIKNGLWIVENPLEVVTCKDGYNKLSEHNMYPSNAIDILPYPLNWQNTIRICYFAGRVMQKADEMGIKLTWGGDWDNDTETRDQSLMDLVHFQRRI